MIVIVSFPVRIDDVLTECSAPRLTVVDACKMEKNRVALFEQMSNASTVFVNIMQTLIATRPNYFFLHPPPPPPPSPPPHRATKHCREYQKQNVEDWSLSLISGRGRVGSEDFVPQMTPPLQNLPTPSSPPPLPSPRRSMITTRTLLKNKI